MVSTAPHQPIEFVLVSDLEPDEFESTLFLEPHESFPRQWQVSAEDQRVLSRLPLGPLESISIFNLHRLYQTARDEGYQLAFFDDPQSVFEWLISLDHAPDVSLRSKFTNTVGGLLPFQVQAHNFALSCERTVFFEHSTGSGKTVEAEAMILSKLCTGYDDGNGFDVCLYVVKPRALTAARLSLGEHTDLIDDSIIVKGSPARRRRIYQEGHPILILNAEKFREDTEVIADLITDKNLLVIVDEIPTKYSHRDSALYRKTAEALYTANSIPKYGRHKGQQIFYPRNGHQRARQMFGVQMSAFPIITSPEGFFNCMRLFDTDVFGSIKAFHETFVRGWDPWGNPSGWKNLDLLAAQAAHVVHHVDKRHPDIAKQFPKKLPPEIINCDLDPNSDKLYSLLLKQYNPMLVASGKSILSFQELLVAIQVFQLICSNPRAVLQSAQAFEDFIAAGEELEDQGVDDKSLAEFWRRNRQGSQVAWKFRHYVNNDALFTDRDAKGNCTISKMLAMREKIDAHGDKAIVFTAFNELMIPFISEWFDAWNISYVAYHGELSLKKGDEILDQFRYDPNIQILISSDAGQDSINLPQASMTHHYDLPADVAYASLEQRDSRQDRIDSVKEFVRSARYIVPGSVESRKLELIKTKQGYHEQVFEGQIAEQAEAFGRRDLIYLITGERDD